MLTYADVAAAARALEYLHAVGVVHADVCDI
jgi:hypothetical protein